MRMLHTDDVTLEEAISYAEEIYSEEALEDLM